MDDDWKMGDRISDFPTSMIVFPMLHALPLLSRIMFGCHALRRLMFVTTLLCPSIIASAVMVRLSLLCGTIGRWVIRPIGVWLLHVKIFAFVRLTTMLVLFASSGDGWLRFTLLSVVFIALYRWHRMM